MLIFFVTRSDSSQILMWIYILHVFDVQQPNLLIVEYLYPMILSAIYPPDQRIFSPIMSVSITFSWSFRALDDVITAQKYTYL